MAGIFLGANEIKYNATPVGNMRIGGTNICKGYVGSTLVFDNCAQANSNVQLNVDTSGISGTQYSLSGDTTGTIKSGQPSTSYSKFTTNIAATGNYSWSSGPTINDAPAGTFPSTPGSTTIVTTTITGTLQAPVGTVSSSIDYDTSGISGWTASAGTISPAQGNTISGTVGSNRIWDVSVTLNTGWTGTITGQGEVGGVFPSTDNSVYTHVLGGSVQQTQYTYQWNFTENLTGATASYNVDGTGSTFSSSAGPISVQGTLNQTSTATISGAPGSNQWQGSDPSYSNGSSQQITFEASTNGGSQTLGISGTASATIGTISLYSYNGSCANDSCINKGLGSLTTFYYYGTDENSATLYTTKSNTNVLSGFVSSGYYAKSSSGQSFSYSPGSSSTVSCIPSVTYTAVATGGYPCGNPLVDYWYINGGFTPAGPLNFVSSTSDGCGGTGITINDGNYWTTTSAGGYGASSGNC